MNWTSSLGLQSHPPGLQARRGDASATIMLVARPSSGTRGILDRALSSHPIRDRGTGRLSATTRRPALFAATPQIASPLLMCAWSAYIFLHLLAPAAEHVVECWNKQSPWTRSAHACASTHQAICQRLGCTLLQRCTSICAHVNGPMGYIVDCTVSLSALSGP